MKTKPTSKTLDDEEAQAILKDVQGIGTSATRANVLEILKKRGYLVTEKNRLHVSEAGITLCKAVELEPMAGQIGLGAAQYTIYSVLSYLFSISLILGIGIAGIIIAALCEISLGTGSGSFYLGAGLIEC
ncbi:hypothetical protein HMPREF0494_2065 [Limosilactobacillus antri DSM 16041]|uniref:DNA topoisomerase TopA n=1 Tax=Limosilactobacillus antri DSM 16041 TaxID=525309 RepID=C8P9S1_9LACO|nr:hypothetical protein HMPREF0494_2065 [Limosilactobacillus antri DSM 16041]KRK54819.1 DNA topoisomerase TopA [Limosilactobacillus antri DSM 16041]